jgi:amino acid transporter
LLSIFLVACLYIVMNISILGVIPWPELVATSKSDTHFFIISVFMQRLYGHWAANIATALIMWTAFASVFSLLLGYSRVPYAAATDGNYFRAFSKLHPKYNFPHISLLGLGGIAALFCFLRLADVIAALVVIRILLQFLVQAVGVIVLRFRRPELPRPFRMWLFPLPALFAAGGFLFVLVKRENALREIRYAALLLTVGLGIYFIRAWRGREWPFVPAPQPQVLGG